jgi:hypothetical protein
VVDVVVVRSSSSSLRRKGGGGLWHLAARSISLVAVVRRRYNLPHVRDVILLIFTKIAVCYLTLCAVVCRYPE